MQPSGSLLRITLDLGRLRTTRNEILIVVAAKGSKKKPNPNGRLFERKVEEEGRGPARLNDTERETLKAAQIRLQSEVTIEKDKKLKLEEKLKNVVSNQELARTKSELLKNDLESEVKIAQSLHDTLTKANRLKEQELRAGFKELDVEEAFVGLFGSLPGGAQEAFDRNAEILLRQLARPRVAELSREQQLSFARRGYRVGDVVTCVPGDAVPILVPESVFDSHAPAEDATEAELLERRSASKRRSVSARLVRQHSATRFDVQDQDASGWKGLWQSMSPADHFWRSNPAKTWHVVGETRMTNMAFDDPGFLTWKDHVSKLMRGKTSTANAMMLKDG